MKQYKLSIVAAVYNLEKYLPRCLDALVGQTLQEIEIICVDDGSTDSAPKIIDEYAQKYPEKVKAFHKENGGEFTTRNYGLERATGEYVTFVDTDDYVAPDWAEKLYNAAKENDADMAVCGFERIDLDTGKVVSTNMTQFGKCAKEVDGKDDFVLFINPAPWNKIYKLEKVKYDSQIHNVNEQDVINFKKYLLDLKQLYIEQNKYESMKYLLDLLAFIHLGTSVMYRASYDKLIDIKKMLKETIKYLDDNFSTWRKSPYLKFGYCAKKGIKNIGLWGISKLYKWNMPMVYIRLYRFAIDKLKIDIKW